MQLLQLFLTNNVINFFGYQIIYGSATIAIKVVNFELFYLLFYEVTYCTFIFWVINSLSKLIKKIPWTSLNDLLKSMQNVSHGNQSDIVCETFNWCWKFYATGYVNTFIFNSIFVVYKNAFTKIRMDMDWTR